MPSAKSDVLTSPYSPVAVPVHRQDEIVREAQTMRQLNHPNLLPLYCSFVHKQHLWMVMPYVQGGSVLNIMRFAYPEVRPGRKRMSFMYPVPVCSVGSVQGLGSVASGAWVAH